MKAKTNTLRFRYIQSDSTLDEERKGFIEAFGYAYKNIPPDVLRVDNIEGFLNVAFDQEVRNMSNQGVIYGRIETPVGELVAYFSLDMLNEVESSDLFSTFHGKTTPFNSVYLRQIYVCPRFQQQGIGKLIVKSLQAAAVIEHIYVSTRKVNLKAQKMYQKCGFSKKDYQVTDSMIDTYYHYEWHKN